jgi:HSP20 family molecular chaperone IbpA
VDGEVLRISGVRRVPQIRDVSRLHQMEIAFGPFERAVRVHLPFDGKQVSAHLEDGFLLISLRKKTAGPRSIEVESE